MSTENPLILAILNELKQSDDVLSLYKLMQILEQLGFALNKSEPDETSEMKLFRKNFVVMNALYQLRKDLSGSGFSLFISSLKIELIPELKINAQDLSVEDSNTTTDDALSDYFLNWDNYHLTDEQGVDELLSSFWDSYTNYHEWHDAKDKRLDSLHALGLKSSASWKDIQQSYRQLITVYHPDKGGDSLKFIKIREAYLILKLTQIKSH
ncbi:MAG: hypothetical protein DIZ80_17175 [endosymbiont of Galathealinum brachiosum]|uniref:J domain-containing protein n=1 Tax=endosymbiont of Galathealinum brachiosum TaxID=2200906 RepID=A0A370D6X1_9GAMM|nr:MAG: hypothetical protein DIZ80_17175 [endosymbiont of Galathealinum brachiosum]